MGGWFGKSLEEELIDKQLSVRETVRNIEIWRSKLDSDEKRERSQLLAAKTANKSDTEINGMARTIAQLIIAKDDLARERQYAIKLESRLMHVASHVELQNITSELEKVTSRVSKLYSEKRATETATNFQKSSSESLAADSKLQAVFSPSEEEDRLAIEIKNQVQHNDKIVLKQLIPSVPAEEKNVKTDEKEDDLFKRFEELKKQTF